MDNARMELEQRIAAADSPEEIERILKAAGEEITAEDAAWLLEEIEKQHALEGRELSLDELGAVAGGAIRNRDYLEEGCAATVEPHSTCWGTDGGCLLVNIDYANWPCNTRCPKCGRYTHSVRSYLNKEGLWTVYACPECGEFSLRDLD